MLSSDHTHSIGRTCHRAQSLSMAKGAAGGLPGSTWLIDLSPGLDSTNSSLIASWLLEETPAWGLSLRGWVWLRVECLPSDARPWLHFITVEKRKENNLSQKEP